MQEVGRYILIQRAGIHRKLLGRNRACVDQLLHQIKYRFHHLQAKGRDQMVILGGNRHHFVCAKGLAIHHKGLHDFRHGLALFAI